jgi:FixJ family two-component response regulator
MQLARKVESIVEDRQSVRKCLPVLVRKLGYAPTALASRLESLAPVWVSRTRRLILYIAMPDFGCRTLRPVQLLAASRGTVGSECLAP